MVQTRQRRLIVFVRLPEPGQCKTRLIPALGPEGAADLHRRLTIRSMIAARRAALRLSLSLEVDCAGGDPSRFPSWLGPDLEYRAQCPGNLGLRMAEAFQSAFTRGNGPVVLIGADCPGLSEETLRQAFEALGANDLVLGPATDGGYYLIGLRQLAPALFSDVAWGTGAVLPETLERAKILRLSVALLEPLSDVDRPQDLAVWDRIQQSLAADPSLPRISVVIPALNEARNIAGALASASCEPAVETIVADGGSVDATLEVAAAYGVRTLTAARGRASQMNAGAAIATGEILLFLHADTRLPAGYSALVREALARPGVAAGAFSFCLDADSFALRLIAWGANLRSRWLRLPYGDQAIFLNASLFRRVGGFPDIPIMEDVALVRALRRIGRIEILPLPATTSARRWLASGPWRLTLIHLAALFSYFLGISPDRIAQGLRRLRCRADTSNEQRRLKP